MERLAKIGIVTGVVAALVPISLWGYNRFLRFNDKLIISYVQELPELSALTATNKAVSDQIVKLYEMQINSLLNSFNSVRMICYTAQSDGITSEQQIVITAKAKLPLATTT